MMRIIKKYCNDRTLNVNNVINGISVVIIPLMMNILKKYREEDFHNRMARHYVDEYGTHCTGFDFIGDWRTYHPQAFRTALGVSRMLKGQLSKFNVDIAGNMIIEIIQAWGWRLSLMERLSIKHEISRIKLLITNPEMFGV